MREGVDKLTGAGKAARPSQEAIAAGTAPTNARDEMIKVGKLNLPVMPQPTQARAVCPNCGQWQTDGDCFNECAKRGFAKAQPASVASAILYALGDLKATNASRQMLAEVLPRAEALEALFAVLDNGRMSQVPAALRRVRGQS